MMILISIIIFFSVIYYSVRYGIGPVPTSRKVKATMKYVIPCFESKTIYELGSGWGSLVFFFSTRYPLCKIYGFEISVFPYVISKLISWCVNRQNIRLYRRNFFAISLSKADVVVCYLYPQAMKRLSDKFKKELKKGTYVITHTFAVPNWKEDNVYVANDIYKTKIYVYRVK
jgi:hypothetical protein